MGYITFNILSVKHDEPSVYQINTRCHIVSHSRV